MPRSAKDDGWSRKEVPGGGNLVVAIEECQEGVPVRSAKDDGWNRKEVPGGGNPVVGIEECQELIMCQQGVWS